MGTVCFPDAVFQSLQEGSLCSSCSQPRVCADPEPHPWRAAQPLSCSCVLPTLCLPSPKAARALWAFCTGRLCTSCSAALQWAPSFFVLAGFSLKSFWMWGWEAALCSLLLLRDSRFSWVFFTLCWYKQSVPIRCSGCRSSERCPDSGIRGVSWEQTMKEKLLILAGCSWLWLWAAWLWASLDWERISEQPWVLSRPSSWHKLSNVMPSHWDIEIFKLSHQISEEISSLGLTFGGERSSGMKSVVLLEHCFQLLLIWECIWIFGMYFAHKFETMECNY